MTNGPSSYDDELRDFLGRRPRGVKLFFRRYFMGHPIEVELTKDEVAERLDWKETETDANDRRIRLINNELVFTMEGLREQFQKVAAVIALFALMIAFGMNGAAKEKTIGVVCAAAMVAVWVMSPRLKIFQFRKRMDSSMRIGSVKTQLDEYYYVYQWLNRREQTLHVAEVLVFLVMSAGILSLIYVGFIA